MKVSEVNESELLAQFIPVLIDHNSKAQAAWADAFGTSNPLVLGPGDDAAVLKVSASTVSTIDTQTENQDFRRTWASGAMTTGYDVGWKSAAQNLGDVASMGAVPVTFLVSLTLTPDTEVDWVTDFARGLCDSLVAHQVPWCTVAGGDLGQGTEISVTVAASGSCEKPVLRSGGQDGDVLAIAGDFGTAAAGLALLDSAAFTPGESEELDALAAAQQRPLAAVTAGMQARDAHAMMDISDGLIRDAERMGAASSLDIDISTAELEKAVHTVFLAAEFLVENDANYAGNTAEGLALHWCLTGGENHGMLAAFAPVEVPQGFTVVGNCRSVAAGEKSKVTVNHMKYRGKGWDHFDTTES